MIDYNKTCLDGCKPKQILNINGIAFNNIDNIVIVNDCGDIYNMSSLEYAYSMDNVCWSCYMSYKEFLEMTIDLKQDYYIRFKIAGSIGKILIDNEEWTNYSTQIDSTFNLTNTTPSSNMYNPYINMVNYFYSLVLHSIENILTEIKFNKIKKGLLESVVTDSIFIPQWFEIISIDYSKMTKKQREKEFMHIMDAIYSYGDYEDYLKMKIDIEKLCKEKNCSLDDLHYEDYPEEIEW